MTLEDITLIQQCETTLETLRGEYDLIDYDYENTKKVISKHDIYLEILSCETIIQECKTEADESSIDEIQQTLNLVYHMELGKKELRDSTLVKLDQVTSKFLSSKRYKDHVDETLLNQYREDMELLSGVEEVIISRLRRVSKEKTWFFFPHTVLIHKYENILKEIEVLEDKIVEAFAFMSEMITSYIVESFHYIYLYFCYIIKYFLNTDNQLLLVDIAASLDRFIKVMQPLKKSTTLKNQNLRNFYVIYELKVLKDLIIQHYE